MLKLVTFFNKQQPFIRDSNIRLVTVASSKFLNNIKYFVIGCFRLLAKWPLNVALKTSTREHLSTFRALERFSIELMNARLHLLYNETCSNNNLLPIFTNVFIFIFI